MNPEPGSRPILRAVRGHREITVEALTGSSEGVTRAEVIGLRRSHGFPGPDWEAEDDTGLILLARSGDEVIGSVRGTHHLAGDGAPFPYVTPELAEYLPRDPLGFVFCSRLVVAPAARSLEVLAVLVHAGVLASRLTWATTTVAGMALPRLVRLYGWLGCAPLSPALPLGGYAGAEALLVGGDLAGSDNRARALIEPSGWELTVPTLVA